MHSEANGSNGEDEEEIVPARCLPVEVITYILHFLSLSDRKNARMVSRTWYEASLDKSLLVKEVVDFNSNVVLPAEPSFDFLPKNRKYFHFVFKEEDVTWRLWGQQQFWEQYAPDLKSLYIFNCDVRERDFTDILLLSRNLESLRMSGLRTLLMPGSLLRNKEDVTKLREILVKLKELWIQHNNYLSDALFDRLTKMAPNLESLSVEGCCVTFHPAIYRKFYKSLEDPDTSDNTEASNCILSFKNILRYIRSRANYIKSLSFGHTLIDSTGLADLASVPELELKSLMVPNCEQLTNAGVIALTEFQRKLKCLDLNQCFRVTDPALVAICSHLSDLEDLRLRRCRAITDASVADLKNLKKLTRLDLSQCDQVTSKGISRGLCCGVNYTLRRLNLSGINNMTKESVISLSENLPSLTHLDLSNCYTAVTDSAVQAIFKNQVFLQVLRLVGCERVTDAGFTGMEGAVHATTPPYLLPRSEPTSPLMTGKGNMRISLRSRAEDDIVRDAEQRRALLQLCEDIHSSQTPFKYSVARLTGLRRLDLSGCTRISDVSLRFAFKFKELQSLDLSRSCQVTLNGLEVLTKNNPTIETLTLSECLSVCDDAVFVITKNLVRLKNLDISGCEKLTKRSLEACKHLKNLNYARCYRMSIDEDSMLANGHSGIIFCPPPPAPKLPSKRKFF